MVDGLCSASGLEPAFRWGLGLGEGLKCKLKLRLMKVWGLWLA